MSRTLHIAVLEPYYGGSHALFVDTLKEYSRHHLSLVTMPARKWKWRMRGAALWFASHVNNWSYSTEGGKVDVILCSDMLSVADLRALLPNGLRNVPIACYFHENQLTYPLPPEQSLDYQYGMTNLTSCLASDAVWFNSRFHLKAFLTAGEKLLGRMPDFIPKDTVVRIRRKASVIPPPVKRLSVQRSASSGLSCPTILWCHRWEYDKNPESFFRVLGRLDEAGYAYKLVLLGEQFRTVPPIFPAVWRRLQPHLLHAGYLPDSRAYHSMLTRCDFVVSTAIQENFGIAVVEAILAGCDPLLPHRLVYPELIPPELHAFCLYPSDESLYNRLRRALTGQDRLNEAQRVRLRSSLERRFAVQRVVPRFDEALLRVADLRT